MPFFVNSNQSRAKSLINRRHFLREISQRTTQVDIDNGKCFTRGFNLFNKPINRVIEMLQRFDKTLMDVSRNYFIDNRIAKLGLIGKMMIKRALGNPGMRQNIAQAGSLKSLAVDFLIRGE